MKRNNRRIRIALFGGTIQGGEIASVYGVATREGGGENVGAVSNETGKSFCYLQLRRTGLDLRCTAVANNSYGVFLPRTYYLYIYTLYTLYTDDGPGELCELAGVNENARVGNAAAFPTSTPAGTGFPPRRLVVRFTHRVPRG